MSSTSPEMRPVGECTAARLRQFADAVMNAGAIREAAEATSELRAPGDEPEEYEVYLDDMPAEFVPRTEDCERCRFPVKFSREGKVTPPYSCDITETCALTAMRMHPEDYTNPDGSPVSRISQCGGLDCGSFMRATPDGVTHEPTAVAGVCTVEARQGTWERTYAKALESMNQQEPTTRLIDDAQMIR